MLFQMNCIRGWGRLYSAGSRVLRKITKTKFEFKCTKSQPIIIAVLNPVRNVLQFWAGLLD